MSFARSRARLGAVSAALLPAVLAVGVLASPAASAANSAANAVVEPAASATVHLILGPGQSGSIGQVVSNTNVTPVCTCDPHLTATFDATMMGTVHVAANTPAGTYTCSVDFQIDGVSIGLTEIVLVDVPGLTVDDATVTEGDSGTVQATFTVTMSEPSTSTVTIPIATADGTATAPADYTAVSRSLSLAPGATTTTVSVPVVGDTLDEPDETFALNLSAATGAAVTDGQGVGTILDDDRNGAFFCRATAVSVGGIEAAVANAPGTPCVDQHVVSTGSGTNLGVLQVTSTALDASTDQTPDSLASTTPAAGDRATASSTASALTINAVGLVSISLTIMTSTATVSCVPSGSTLVPSFSSSSSVTGLSIDGVTVPVGSAPQDIPLVIGTLHLNSTVTTGTSVTRRAVWLQSALGDVVAAESVAGVQGSAAHPAGNPCVTR
jgi:hypothetical protein